MLQNKTILIVGAGFGQVPAILTAKKIGLRVIGVDRNPNAIGMNLLDEAFVIDVTDYKSILQLSIEKKIDGIFTMQSDLPVPSIGYVNENLNLTGIKYKAAIIASNKIETRECLLSHNVDQPLFEIVRNDAEANVAANAIGYPCVIKAIDSSGSRGVTVIKSSIEIQAAVESVREHSRKREFLVEEFISGLELGAQTFSVDGECVKILFHNDTIADNGSLVPIGHSFPSSLSLEQKIRAETSIKNALKAIGISDGPANIDLILDDKTQIVNVIEIGARIGATCLPELVYFHTGIDWVKNSILNCIGEKTSFNSTTNIAVAAHIIYSTKTGYLRKVEPPISKNQDFSVLEVELTVKVGDRVNKLEKGTDRIGKIICSGNDVFDAEKKARTYFKNFSLYVE